MNILIVDDEPLARARLQGLLSELEGNHQVVGVAANGRDALKFAAELAPDLILLDIRMPVMDGLETARHLATLEHPPAVVFTTAYGDHALAAFEAHAVDYLLKPIRKSRLAQALDKAVTPTRAQLAALGQAEPPANDGQRARTHLSALSHGRIQIIPIQDIIYFQADQKYISVYHRNGEVLIEESLSTLESEFGERFVRIHRNALIAANSLVGMEKDENGHAYALLRDCETRLAISRSHVAQVRRWLRGG